MIQPKTLMATEGRGKTNFIKNPDLFPLPGPLPVGEGMIFSCRVIVCISVAKRMLIYLSVFFRGFRGHKGV